MSFKIFASVAVACLSIASTPLLADTVKVGNGDTINGEIITYQDGLCIFRSNYGAPFSIPIEKIVSISTNKKVKIL